MGVLFKGKKHLLYAQSWLRVNPQRKKRGLAPKQ